MSASALPVFDRHQAMRLSLLRALAACGSISAAARQVGLSYKGAWQILESMNNASSEPLLIRNCGGSGGGGTRLTARGQALLAAGDLLTRMAETLGAALEGQHDGTLLARLGLQTSARNQLIGHVARMDLGAVNDLIHVVLPNGHALQVSITRESTRHLPLAPGSEVLLLFKAGALLLTRPQHTAGIALPNRLDGHISQILLGTVNSEVTLTLPQGIELHAMLDSGTLAALALQTGQEASALISPGDIILATLA